MGGVIIFGFIGCIICGWIIGISEKDDRGNVLFEHYNIIQEEITTTTYKIIPNG